MAEDHAPSAGHPRDADDSVEEGASDRMGPHGSELQSASTSDTEWAELHGGTKTESSPEISRVLLRRSNFPRAHTTLRKKQPGSVKMI